jgi:predicted SpoU family rRNA methylase
MPVNYYMKRNISVFLAAVFLMCVCARGVLAQDANWRIAESDTDFIGRWEGRIIIPVHEDMETMMPESFINFTISLEYFKNQGNAGANFRVNLKVDVEKFLNDFLNMPGVRQFGLTIDSLWDMLIGDIKRRMDISGSSGVSVQKYSISYNVSENVDEFYNNSSLGTIFLNENNTRMKLFFNEPLDSGFGGEEVTEIILDKIG